MRSAANHETVYSGQMLNSLIRLVYERLASTRPKPATILPYLPGRLKFIKMRIKGLLGK